MMAEILGIDFSRYQYLWNEDTGEMLRTMNFEVAAAAGARFAAGRVTLGESMDYAFDYRGTYCSLKACQAAGIPTTGYHVIWPSLTVDRQMSAFFRALDKQSFREDFAVWLDCERSDRQSVSTQTRVIAGAIEWFWKRRGYFPDIYTNVGYWDTNTVHDPIFDQCQLIVANYTTAKTPLVPREWKKLGGLVKQWKIWQFSADGNGLGAKYGAASRSIDLNRLNGGEPEYRAMLFSEPPVPVEPEPQPPPAEVQQVRVRASGLRVRSAPVIANETIRFVASKGQTFEVERTEGDWAQVKLWMHRDYLDEI
jgi:GH25 family lysozyme M1 (1,4-beta-N-acetylmuramidase)